MRAQDVVGGSLSKQPGSKLVEPVSERMRKYAKVQPESSLLSGHTEILTRHGQWPKL